MNKRPTNLTGPVHRRLLDGARKRGEDFQRGKRKLVAWRHETGWQTGDGSS